MGLRLALLGRRADPSNAMTRPTLRPPGRHARAVFTAYRGRSLPSGSLYPKGMWASVPRAPARRSRRGLLFVHARTARLRERILAVRDVLARQNGLRASRRFIPDVSAAAGRRLFDCPTQSSLIVSGMRVIDHADGSIERARQVLPTAAARVHASSGSRRNRNLRRVEHRNERCGEGVARQPRALAEIVGASKKSLASTGSTCA